MTSLLQSILSPPPRVSPSEWAERFAFLPHEGNAEEGKYRLSRMPHQAAMLDDPMRPGCREVYWQMASQAAGKTMCLVLLCEYVIHQMRRSILMTRATKETALEWMRDKFLPTVDATPCMGGLLVEPRKRDSKSTSFNRKFPGGSLKLIGAKSPAAFRSSSAQVIFCDEVDSYVAIKEGDPIKLADRAAMTFSDAWKIRCSTPTLLGFSKINDGFESGDKQYYNVPCPHCGKLQSLKTEQLKFTFTDEEFERIKLNSLDRPYQIGDFVNRDTARAIYLCEFCHRGWTDQMRMLAYKSGHPDNPSVVVNGQALRAEWIATAAFRGITSRHLNGMYLTMGLEKGFDSYLHQFAQKFLEAKKGGRETLMVWTNTVKNEPYEDASEKVDWAEIKERAEDFGPELPMEAVFPVFGLDVQQDRVEVIDYVFGDDQEVWCMGYKVLYGNFDTPEMEEKVADYLLTRKFKHPILGDLSYHAGCLDSGHQTKVRAVYRFCQKHSMRNFFSVRGRDNTLASHVVRRKIKGFNITGFDLNTDYFKNLIFDRLRSAEPGARYIHFQKEDLTVEGEVVKTKFTAEFYMQLCSEKRFREKSGAYRWKKTTSSARNEVLDMTVYAFGCFEICNQESKITRLWKEVQARMKAGTVATPPKDYILQPGKVMEKKQPARAGAVVRKLERRGGGMFNPLNL